MERKIVKSALLNNPVPGDIDTTTYPGFVKIKGLHMVPADAIKGSIVKITATPEQRQLVRVTMPTIAASTRYAIKLYSTEEVREGWHRSPKTFGQTSPAALASGPVDNNPAAAVDKYNVILGIAYKINQAKLHTVAGARVRLIHQTIGAGLSFAEGALLLGVNSGAKAYVRQTDPTEPIVDVISGRFQAGENITGSDGNSTTLDEWTITGDMMIYDDPGYYPPKGSRRGVTNVYASQNIPPANVVVVIPGVYQFGQGDRMLKDIPVIESSTSNISSGILGFPTNEPPLSGKQYNAYIIPYKQAAATVSFDGPELNLAQVLYLRTDAAGFAATENKIMSLV